MRRYAIMCTALRPLRGKGALVESKHHALAIVIRSEGDFEALNVFEWVLNDPNLRNDMRKKGYTKAFLAEIIDERPLSTE